jgi:hypothetical protein
MKNYINKTKLLKKIVAWVNIVIISPALYLLSYSGNRYFNVGNVLQYRAFRLQYRIFKMEDYSWRRRVGDFIPVHTTGSSVSKRCFCNLLIRNWIRYLVIYFFRPCTAVLSLYCLINNVAIGEKYVGLSIQIFKLPNLHIYEGI